MNASDRESRKHGQAVVRKPWEPMRLDYLGDVAELVAAGDDPPGKNSFGTSPDSPKPKSPGL